MRQVVTRDAARTNGLREPEGHRVTLTVADGSQFDDVLLVSAGRGGTSSLWLEMDGMDLFIHRTQVLTPGRPTRERRRDMYQHPYMIEFMAVTCRQDFERIAAKRGARRAGRRDSKPARGNPMRLRAFRVSGPGWQGRHGWRHQPAA